MSSEINLSSIQQKVVVHVNGALLVRASAGSGKTRVLTERIKKLLKQTKRKILAITFTNKAGEEMRDRLSDLSDLNERLFIGTFHGFCEQVLQNHGAAIGLKVMPHLFEDEADRLKLIEQAIVATPSYFASYKMLDVKQQRDYRYKVLNFISSVKRDKNLLHQYNDENLILLNDTYKDILISQNAIDFDDLILLTCRLFSENATIAALYRRSYEFICIDEAQDLNNAQYDLIKALTNGEHKNVMMVGDQNQSIFAFNGSSADFMNKCFVDDYKPLIIEMTDNYRSSKRVLNIADQIISNSNLSQNAVIEGKFEIYSTKDEEDEAECICGIIKSLINQKKHTDIEGEINYEKIAVLARTRYVFKKLEEKFNTNNIPYYYKTTPGSILFESDLMKIFDQALRVKLNPQDSLHLNKMYMLLGLNGKRTSNLNDIAHMVTDALNKDIIKLVAQLENDGKDLIKLFKTFKEDLYSKNDYSDDYKNMIDNDITELLKHWHNYSKKTDITTLHNFKNAMGLGQTHPSAQNKGITLSTVHTMKGLEYDIVFIMGMDNETFPDYRAKSNIDKIQEKNNFYVAVTRAKRFLFVTWPQKRLMPWGEKHRMISPFIENLII